MGLMLALMQLSALSLWGMWCYQAGPFVSETAALLDRWMESDLSLIHISRSVCSLKLTFSQVIPRASPRRNPVQYKNS